MFNLGFLLMVLVELYAYFIAIANVMMWTIIALHVLFVLLYTYLFLENR